MDSRHGTVDPVQMAKGAAAFTAREEHRFWLQVLGDHARFIQQSLAPREAEEIRRAEAFIGRFDQLLNQARQPSGDSAAERMLAQEALLAATDLRGFKLHLLTRHLTGGLQSSLPPTFFNHMLNELEEYLRLLQGLLATGTLPQVHAVHHHVLWLLDAAGHADAIQTNLDGVESDLREKSRSYKRQFESFYLKAVEMAGYLRTRLQDFPALARFNRQVELEMALFRGFLQELEEMRLEQAALGVLAPLMADHMAREECYYLHKLAASTGSDAPGCDPAKPRAAK